MKKIRIILGGYGYVEKPGAAPRLVTAKDEPIMVEDKEAIRLVNLKCAEIVSEKKAEANEDAEEVAPVQQQEENGMVTGHLDADDLESYTVMQLRSLAKDMGLKQTGSKEKLIQRIAEAEVQYEEEEAAEEPPILEAAEPEA